MKDLEDLLSKVHKPLKIIRDEDINKLESIIYDFINSDVNDKDQLNKFIKQSKRKYKVNYGISQLRYIYNVMLASKKIIKNSRLEDLLVTKKVRETSGVIVFTLLTSPYPETGENDPTFDRRDVNFDIRKINPDTGEKRQDFSCQFDCFYCPNYPDMPRSYIPDEPAVARGIENKWDAVDQIRDRAKTYIINGINIDKVEVIIEGGTYTSYPEFYRLRFIRDIFYAFNTLFDNQLRDRYALEKEIKINEENRVKVVGISIETRPDCISKKNVLEFRSCGITRIQLGIQHTNDEILRKINRQCTTSKAKKAIKLLKNTGFKIAIHLMPDLPYSNPDEDVKMMRQILEDEEMQVDYIKVYPTCVTPHTKIKKWYDDGLYKPYAETTIQKEVNGQIVNVNPLIEVIIDFKSRVHPWIRNERIVRDIPPTDIEGGNKTTNLRQLIQNEMKKRGLKCNCIRCREIRDRDFNPKDITLLVRSYKSSHGDEYFISYENNDKSIIYGFCRLRLSSQSGEGFIEELKDCALIRELHVYGKMKKVGDKSDCHGSQHLGLGTLLLQNAEDIAYKNGYNKIAVISGVGVKNYYRKKGYIDGNYYLIKNLSRSHFDRLTKYIPREKLTQHIKYFILAIVFVLFVSKLATISYGCD